MAYQQLLNSATPATTLAADCTSGATTISVNSIANLSSTPIYTIGVRTSGVVEWMLVTGISGSGPYTLTVTRGQESTSGAAHFNGDPVYCVGTAGSLIQALRDTSGVGTYANRPTSTTGARAGMRYVCTDPDKPYEFIFDGSAWQQLLPRGYLVGAYTPIVSANWTTFGSGGTRTNITGVMQNGGDAIEIIGKTGTQGVYGVSRTLPAGDCTHYLTVWPAPTYGNFSQVGIGFSDGTKTNGVNFIFITNYAFIATYQATALTGATYAGITGSTLTNSLSSTFLGGPIFVRLTRTGTTYSGAISTNGGITYTTLFIDTAPFLTANAIQVSADPRGCGDAPRITLVSSSLQ